MDETDKPYELFWVTIQLMSRREKENCWIIADLYHLMDLQDVILDIYAAMGYLIHREMPEEQFGAEQRWLIWARNVQEAYTLVAASPLGRLGVFNGVLCESTTNAPRGREAVERYRLQHENDPEPPIPANMLELLLDRMNYETFVERMEDPLNDDWDRLAIWYSLYCRMEDVKEEGDSVQRNLMNGRKTVFTNTDILQMGERIIKFGKAVKTSEIADANLRKSTQNLNNLRAYFNEWGINPEDFMEDWQKGTPPED